MKKIILSLLVALMATTGANAQETLTVYEDASVYSENVPVNGWNADNYLKCEFVIPATEISAMEGGTISQMTFYLKQLATKAWTGTFQVFLKEVNSTTINAYSGTEGATTVYTGTLDATGSTMTIPFSTIYTYRGGNLLVGIYETAKGNFDRAYFYGVTATGASGQYYDSFSLDAVVTFVQKDFLPKTTFTYTMPVPAGPTTSGIDWNPSTNSGTFTMPAYDVEVNTELWYLVSETKTLAENKDAYGEKSDFFLNRTLTANVWNTFASPFAIAAGDMTKYFGAEAKVRQLNTTSVDGTVLTLNFTDATSIVAGQPYLVKPTADVDFSADGKEFAGVDLTAASATPTPTTYVNFVPTLGKTEVTGDVKDILILNTSGTLVHPSAVGNMKGFRGYFLMHEAAANLARAFVINFGEGETTGIQPIRMENGTTPAEGTYDLSGRRIQGQPTQKGVYIQNGKKVVIK